MKLLVTGALLLGFHFGTCAQAVEPGDAAVSYTVLEAQSANGAHTLYSRIEAATAKVCERYSAPSKDLARSRVHARCMKDTLARAVSDINQLSLTQYAAEQSQARRSALTLARK
jgi:UrcA family protein